MKKWNNIKIFVFLFFCYSCSSFASYKWDLENYSFFEKEKINNRVLSCLQKTNESLLDLSGCNLKNETFIKFIIPFLNNHAIKNLDISNNELDDSIFLYNFNLNLNFLSLSQNAFENLPIKKGSFCVKELEVSDSPVLNLSGISNLRHVKGLSRLSMASCWGKDNWVKEITVGFVNKACEILKELSIEYLDVTDNNLTNYGALSLFQNKNLKHLDMSRNPIDDFDSPYISVSPIMTLNLTGTRIGSKFLKRLSKNKSIEELVLRNTNLEHENLIFICFMKLKKINLMNNNLTENDKTMLKQSQFLEEILF